MGSFENEKKQALNKKDKSRKQSVDEKIKKLIKIMNNKNNYYTTSSCAGRILLITLGKKKQNTKWIFTSHNKIRFIEISDYLKKLPKEKVYFRQEAFILHVACRSLDDAQRLLDAVRSVRRKGILSSRGKIVVEIIGSPHFEAIIAKNGKLLIGEGYLKHLIEEANLRLVENWKKIKGLERQFTNL